MLHFSGQIILPSALNYAAKRLQTHGGEYKCLQLLSRGERNLEMGRLNALYVTQVSFKALKDGLRSAQTLGLLLAEGWGEVRGVCYPETPIAMNNLGCTTGFLAGSCISRCFQGSETFLQGHLCW